MSIGSKQTLSMIPSLPTSPKKHMLRVDERELLKHAVIFGANSSGKSNFLRAMAFGKQIVLAGLSPKFKFAYSKLGDDSQPRITTWEYTFFINHHFFSYGFSVNFNTLEIVEEWLLEIDPQTDHSHLLFERHVAEQSFYSPINNYHLAGSDVKAKMLLVSDYHRHSQISVLATVYQWFAKHLVVVMEGQALKRWGRVDEDYQNTFLKLIADFDTGIEAIALETMALDDFQALIAPHSLSSLALDSLQEPYYAVLINNQLYRLRFVQEELVEVSLVFFKHRNSPFLFSFGEESDGTKRIIELTDFLINACADTSYVWDELDRSIHPLLLEKFLEKYWEISLPNQLIFSTHETHLLARNLWRRDEIWFMEKALDQSSKLYSLDIFKERLSKQLATSYLEGHYGGIPNLNLKDEQ